MPAAALAVLVTAGFARAHVVPEPSFVEAGATTRVGFAGPNERDEPMTGLRLRVPSGISIVSAHGRPGWTETASRDEALWSGGSLAPGSEETFDVELIAPPDPGPLVLEAEQLYAGGDVVRWDVPLTVVPGEETSSGPSRAAALGIAAALVLVAAGIVALARRHRLPPGRA